MRNKRGDEIFHFFMLSTFDPFLFVYAVVAAATVRCIFVYMRLVDVVFFLQTKQAKNNSYTRPWWTITANRNNNNKKGTQRFQKRLMSPSLQIDTKCDTVIWYVQWHFRILFPFIRSTHSTDFGCMDTNSISINDARQCANILALLLCECNVATINNALYMIIIYI